MTSLSEFRLRVGAAAAAMLIFCAIPSNAVDPHRMISQYARDRWTIENEFPGGAISAIAQTPDGYLWIGTEKGLFRFDGLSFRVFQQASPESLPIGPVQKLMTDNTGNLWVLLANTKLLRFHDGKFELGREEAEVGVTAIGKRANGAPLFASLAYGPLTYQDGRFLSIFPSSDLSSMATAPSSDDLSTRLSWATTVAAHHLAQPDSAVTTMVETSDGHVWLGTRDRGLFCLDHGPISQVRLPGVSRDVRSLLSVENGDIWIGTERGVFRWNGKEVSQIGISPALRQAEVRAMIRDRDANVWVGTTAGLARVNSEGISFDDVGSDRRKPVTALFEDREGNLWIGRSQGIERLRETAFVTYPLRTSREEESGGPVFVDATGRVWFASFKGGLQWLRQGQGGIVSNDDLNQDVVYSITGGDGELWIGRQRGGLTRLRYGAGRNRARTYTVSDGLAENSVYAVYRSRDGSVWAATLNAGLSQFVNGRFQTYSTANGLRSNTVTSIDEGPDGTMWFGTPDGLVAFSRNKWSVFKSRDGLPSDNITCLLADSTNTLWIGTISGLALLQSGRIKTPDRMPSSLREEILGIAGDNSGNLWIATSNHILSVKRWRLLSTTLTESDVRQYGFEDGLVGNQGVKRFRSAFADTQGKIWFSTDRGLAVVDSLRADRESAPVIVEIESLSADGNSLELEPPIRVPPDTHRLTFSFSGLSLSDPKRIQFKYKLDGFDKDWNEPVLTRAAVYTNVGWGSYTFRVMACNNSGVWNEAGTSLDFSIAPAYYQTTWFRVSSVAVFLVLLGGIYRLRVQQLRHQFAIGLEARINERTRIARDLHDTLLQSFQGLMLHFQTGIDLLPGRPVEARKTLEIASDRADQAIAEGRDAVKGLRASTVETNDLAAAIRTLGEELRTERTNQNSALFEMEVEGTPRTLHPILRDEVYRIAGEALRNAFRHARAQRIEVEILYGEQRFRLRVRDDGKGIDPKLLSGDGLVGHYGLHGMRERAKLVGGRLAVWSKLDSGAEVELSIPASIAYVKSARHRSWLFEKLSGKGTDFKETDVKETKTKS